MVRVGGGVPNRAGAGGQGRAGPRALSAPPSLVTIFLAAIQPRLLAASGALALQRARYPAAPRRLGPRLRSAPPARLCRSSRGGPQVPAAPALAPRRWTTTPGMPWTRGGVSHKAARGSAPPGPGAADPRSRRPAGGGPHPCGSWPGSSRGAGSSYAPRAPAVRATLTAND